MKILFIGLNWLGDVIMSLPTINSALSLCEVHVITRPHLADVYRLFSDRIVVYSIETGKSIFSVWPDLNHVRQVDFDHCIVLPDSLRSAAVAKAATSAPSTGYSGQWRSALLSNPVLKPANFTEIHESELHFNLLSCVYRNTSKAELPLIKFNGSEFSKIFSRLEIAEPQKFYLMAPGAAFGSAKRWPPQRFAELADLLQQHSDLPVILTGSAAETGIAREIKATATKARFIDLTGKTDISELAILLFKAEALFANDSGTMHLTALTQTPTVVPVGPTDMTRTGPLNKNFRAVISDACPLIPCRKRICQRSDHACMLAISARNIFDAFNELTGKGK